MKRFLSEVLLRIQNPVDQYLDQDYSIDPKKSPESLTRQLRDEKRSLKRFINKINEKEEDGGKLMHKFMIVHLILIHCEDFCEPFQKINFKNQSKDQWLNTNIIMPYCLFLQKICHCQQTYRNMKTSMVVQISFERLFFVRKILFLLLQAADKLSNLGRYCDISQKRQMLAKHAASFVDIMAYHCQVLYSIFKANLGQLLSNHERYITCSSKVRIMKYLLKRQLQDLNESVKILFLNKRFCPLHRGYGIKLFKIEDLSDKVQQFLQSTIFPVSHIKRPATLDSLIFDRSGRVNQHLIFKLKEVTLNKKESIQQIKIRKIRSATDFSQHIQNV